MQAFKIVHYRCEHPGEPTPRFFTLAEPEETQAVRELLACAGSPQGSAQAVMRQLEAASTHVHGLDLDCKQVALSAVFSACGIYPEREIYIQWGPLCEIDRFDVEELERCFYDIWYPGADDIELFDRTFSWLVFVSHFGCVSVWRTSE